MDKPQYEETELVEWSHFTICTEGMTDEEKDMLYDVIRTITKKYPQRKWGINLVPYTDFKELGFKTPQDCSCDDCRKRYQGWRSKEVTA